MTHDYFTHFELIQFAKCENQSIRAKPSNQQQVEKLSLTCDPGTAGTHNSEKYRDKESAVFEKWSQVSLQVMMLNVCSEQWLVMKKHNDIWIRMSNVMTVNDLMTSALDVQYYLMSFSNYIFTKYAMMFHQ